ncbi:Spermidine/putrescine import ATP-binding protein PotA OS=Castellaniella defragrans OX=75697 GN=potA PE=3 SV=1 [Castellaniella defragrans]
MDKPLGALDKQLREHMQLKLKALHSQLGVTFVYVTHNQSEALTMSDRIAVFDQGVIQQVSQASTLYEKPCNRFVAGFVGDSNQFEGTVRRTTDEHCTVELTCGTRLRGLNVQRLPEGSPCIVAMRPERITPAAEEDSNQFQASAVDEVYCGDHIRLRCRIDEGSTFFVKIPLSEDPRRHSPGTHISLQVDPQHVRVFQP